MMGGKRLSGFSLVELLVVVAILGIVLTLLTAFFVQQTRVSRQTQARNEVETKVRTVAELIVQDLQVAGSNVIFNAGTATDVPLGCSANAIDPCVRTVGANRPLTLFYATSLRPAAPCRRVDYRLTAAQTLQRVEQGNTSCLGLDNPSDAAFNINPLATNILGVDIAYSCADESLESDPATCYANGSFPRQAIVTISGRADSDASIVTSVTLATALPNLRN
jgi:prepilin-type N-terminal cleavage/methylation domain-containing protein